MGETTWTARGAATDLLTTEMNSLADAGSAISTSEFDNSTNLDLFCDLEFSLASIDLSAVNNPAVYVWFINNLSVQEDGSGSIIPARIPDVIIPLREVSAAQVVAISRINCPNISFDTVVQNETGVAFAGTTNILKIETYGITTA